MAEPQLSPNAELELRKLELEHTFQAKVLELEHKFEREKIAREEHFKARQEYAKQMHEDRLQFEKHFKEYGQLALRSLFLLNGGALVALLAFIGTSLGKNVEGVIVTPAMFIPAFWKFTVGLLLIAIAMGVSYANYQLQFYVIAHPANLVNNMIQPTERWPGNNNAQRSQLANVTWIGAILTAILAGALFLWACTDIVNAFAAMRAPSPTRGPAAVTTSLSIGRVLNTVGLTTDIIGAMILGYGLFVSSKKAVELSVSRWSSKEAEENMNQPQVLDRLRQSRLAVTGLFILATGFVLQVVAVWQ